MVGCGIAPCHWKQRNCCCLHHRLGRGRKAAVLLGRKQVLDPNIGIGPLTAGSGTQTKDCPTYLLYICINYIFIY